MHRLRRDASGKRTRFGHQLVVVDDLGDQPDAGGFLGVEEIAGERHLVGLRQPHRARQVPRATVARDEADAQEALGELGAAAGDPDVAHGGEVAAGADGRAIDRGDRGRFQPVHGQRDALDALLVGAPDLGRAAGEEVLAVLHLLDVAARREPVARAGKDHATHRQVGVDAVRRLDQRLDDGGRDGVSRSGFVQRQRDDAAVLLVQYWVSHAPQASLV